MRCCCWQIIWQLGSLNATIRANSLHFEYSYSSFIYHMLTTYFRIILSADWQMFVIWDCVWVNNISSAHSPQHYHSCWQAGNYQTIQTQARWRGKTHFELFIRIRGDQSIIIKTSGVSLLSRLVIIYSLTPVSQLDVTNKFPVLTENCCWGYY